MGIPKVPWLRKGVNDEYKRPDKVGLSKRGANKRKEARKTGKCC